MTIGSGAEQIDLHYFGPAHTGGDAFVVFTAARVMHVGDTMPTRALPIMDKNNGGTGVGYAATMAKASRAPTWTPSSTATTPTTTTPADVALYSEFIARLRDVRPACEEVRQDRGRRREHLDDAGEVQGLRPRTRRTRSR